MMRKTKVGIERIQIEAKTRKVWKGAVSSRSPRKLPKCSRNVSSEDDGAISSDLGRLTRFFDEVWKWVVKVA